MAMDDPLALAMLTAACAVAEGALPEREPHPRVFEGLLRPDRRTCRAGRRCCPTWSAGRRCCWPTSATAWTCRTAPSPARRPGLAYVSPRTGRAVTAAAAGVWTHRLLPLPGFLVGANTGGAGGLARRAAPDRPFPGARRLRPSAPAAAAGAADAVRPRRGAGGSPTSRGAAGSRARVSQCRMIWSATSRTPTWRTRCRERYLAYALSTIMSRSLPDVRDGLKPVHRRLIYAMHQLRLDPDRRLQEMRPRGRRRDRQIPPARRRRRSTTRMVRLAQDFAARYPLVEGQGNFGNIDGDNPAAMRYTEARLTAGRQRDAGRHRRGRGRFPPDL